MLLDRRHFVIRGNLKNTSIVEGNGANRLRRKRGARPRPAPTKTIEGPPHHWAKRTQILAHAALTALPRYRFPLVILRSSYTDDIPKFEPFTGRLRLNIKLVLTRYFLVGSLRGDNADAAHTVGEFAIAGPSHTP